MESRGINASGKADSKVWDGSNDEEKPLVPAGSWAHIKDESVHFGG